MKLWWVIRVIPSRLKKVRSNTSIFKWLTTHDTHKLHHHYKSIHSKISLNILCVKKLSYQRCWKNYFYINFLWILFKGSCVIVIAWIAYVDSCLFLTSDSSILCSSTFVEFQQSNFLRRLRCAQYTRNGIICRRHSSLIKKDVVKLLHLSSPSSTLALS